MATKESAPLTGEQHCGHECVCQTYCDDQDSYVDGKATIATGPCICIPCPHDTRPCPSPAQPADAPVPEEVKKEMRRLKHSEEFYHTRCNEIQKLQSQMRDPERQVICEILANGKPRTTLQPEETSALPIETCNICDLWVGCDRVFGKNGYPPCVQRAIATISTAAKAEVLDKSPCIWTENEDGIYETGCNNMFEVMNGETPKENKFGFCPFCGKPIGSTLTTPGTQDGERK